jgi:hypothetical protein
LLGTEKIGKSTLAAGADRPIFLPIKGEEGIDEIPVRQFPTCNTFYDVWSALEVLRGSDDCGTGVMDSMSAFEPLIHEAQCQHYDAECIEKVMGGFGKGHTDAVNWVRRVTDFIDILRAEKNMAFILIGHVEVATFNDPAGPSYEHYTFDIHRKVRNHLYRWADLILFMNTKVSVDVQSVFGKDQGKAKDFNDGDRFIYTQKRPAHPGGGRGAFGNLPYEIRIPKGHNGWEILMSHIQ